MKIIPFVADTSFCEQDMWNIMSNRWNKKKVYLTIVAARDTSEINFLKITRTCCSTELMFSIITHVNLSKSKHYSVKTFEKTSIKFHVPSHPKRFLFIFRNIGRSITDENSFHVLLSKCFFSKHCSFTKISSTFISFINFLLKFSNKRKCRNTVNYNV